MTARQQPMILVVDNNAELAEMIGEVLRLYQFTVVVCLHSQQAQALITKVEPDLIILDVEMPTLDGIDLFTRLRAQTPVPVIFFTANPSSVTTRLVDYKARGATLIAKPNVNQLPLAVRQALNHPA